VNRRPYSLTMSAAFASLKVVAKHHASFMRGACTTTTAGTAARARVTRAPRIIVARPVGGTHFKAGFRSPSADST
jgi:hypothetical protein